MNLKRILYIAPALPVGGAEKFLVSLSAALSKNTDKQILVSLQDNNPLLPEFDKSIHFFNLVRRNRFDMKPVFQLRKLVQTEKPDIIFCLNFFAYFFARIALVGSTTRAQMVISYHSTIQLVKKEHLLHKLYAFMLRKKDVIITVSNNQAKHTATTYKIPASSFKTIHNGIDTNYWIPAPAGWNRNSLLAQYGIPENAKVIIMSAALRHEKNHIGAVKALGLLRSKYNYTAFLLLVGDGVMREDIQKTVAELQIGSQVIFAGNQNNVLPFYQASDLFTLCSHSETFSMAALEALSCGLPGVMTDVGGASEMIREGFNGFLCHDDAPDIARAWHLGLTTNFSTQAIHEHVVNNFSRETMFGAYRNFLGLTDNNS